MQNLSARAVPNHYGTAWISTASKLVMVNYPQTLGVTAIMFLTHFIGLRAGPIGGPILGIITSFLVPGIFVISADYMKFEKSEFMKLFIALQDKELFSRVVPYIGFVFAYTLFNSLFLPTQPFASFLLSLVFTPIALFAVPLMTFHKMSFRESITFSIDAAIKNIIPLLILGVCLSILLLSLLILLVLPLFFYGLPLFYLLFYPVYASVFLGLDVDTLNAELKRRVEGSVPSTMG
ncbi:MAG: hypothetical protein A4S09_05435 [Proteobacteria bacterium SG_bin7]|nr:MAG: hypothetical protein A4S09_05435 [Proteobacteria bacterium SG_bin7]